MSRRIAIASAIWTVALLLSRVTGLVRDSVLGTTLGVGGDADVYAAAFRIPDTVSHVISGGALSIVFIPMFTRLLSKGDEARAWRAFSLVANFVLVLAAILIPLGWWFMPELAAWFAPGFSPEKTELLVRLSRIVLPAQVFHLLSGLLGASLLSRDKHLVPALAPLLYNVGIIAGGWLGGNAEGFAWGVLVGAFAGPFLLPLWAAWRSGLRWQPILSFADPDLRHYLAAAVPIMLAFSVVGADDTVWTWFASSVGEGSIAVLTYAKTLMKVPLGVFGFAMGYAAYPTLARLCAEGKPGEAYRTLVTATRRALFLAFGSQVALTVAGPEIATAVYSTSRIAPERMTELGLCLGVFALSLGAWTAQTLISRGFYARGRAWLPTWLGFAVLLTAIPVYGLLADRFGAVGLAAASSLATIVYTGVLQWRLRHEIGEGPGYSLFLVRCVVATMAGIAVGFALRNALPAPEWTRVDGILRAIALCGAGGGVFLAVCWLLGVEEVRAIVRRR